MSVLVVEDDAGIGRFLTRGLAAEGIEVEWVRSGISAAERLRAGGFAAAVLDLGLPGIDGLSLCRDLRRDGIAIPVLILTARDQLDDKLAGFDAGADDYLSKPFAFAELLARLRVLLRRGEATDAVVRVGALELNLRSRTAAVGGRPLALSPRQFDLLACLAQSADRTVTRGEIFERAWGGDAEVSENLLDVYIGYLRRRLTDFSEAPRIETVRGVGYRINA